ncbi:MAG TPA: glutathionylspermidine synthase family protein [Thermoanaerobaculia bacterium]|nr:glutathionylspermidine synthase family protein [Thermoanaerobaculia bacterium]
MDVTTSPWRAAAAIEPARFAGVRRQAIFECCKWDPQVEDVATLAPYPLVLRRETWRGLAVAAEALAAETLAAEAELVSRPELHTELGLPRAIRSALRRAGRRGAARSAARVMRFDFHATPEGWQISEVNSDVPGGFNEASGFTRLMAAHFPGTEPAGDPAGRLADAIAATVSAAASVALVHATAYTDDRQVMVFLARELEARGLRPVLTGPDHLRWQDGRARLASDAFSGPLDFLLRFFPAEWLPNLPRTSGWTHFFCGSETPASNPAYALLTQSKRFPLVWERLLAALPTWQRLLPETRDPRDASWRYDEGWVLKPALGRVGDLIGVAGATEDKEWKVIHREVRRHPRHWVAQRRFTAVPLQTAEGSVYPCVGVYTVDGHAAGAYGRAASRPRIDHLARDLAVLVERESNDGQCRAV